MKKRFVLVLTVTLLTSLACAEKMRVAVLDLQPKNASPELALAVSDYIRVEMVKYDTYELLDRDNMNVILKEQAFQQSGCTSAECAVEIGQLLNCQKMFVGSLSKIGSTFFLTMQRVDVETAKVDYADAVEAKDEDGLVRAAAELSSGMAIGKVEKEKRHKFFTGGKRSWRIELGGTRLSLGEAQLMLGDNDVMAETPISGYGLQLGFRYCPGWRSRFMLGLSIGLNDMSGEAEYIDNNVSHNSKSYKVSYKGLVEDAFSLAGQLHFDLSDRLGLRPQTLRLMGGIGVEILSVQLVTNIVELTLDQFDGGKNESWEHTQLNLVYKTLGLALSVWKIELSLAMRFRDGKELQAFSDSLGEGLQYDPEMVDFPLFSRQLSFSSSRATILALSFLF